MKVDALLPIKNRQFEYARQMQSEDYEDNPPNLAQENMVGLQKTSYRTGGRTKRNEGKRETAHEHERMKKCAQTGFMLSLFLLFICRLINAVSHQLRQVNRYQWQHAWREKGG
jgi:hypothetical protein